MAAGSFANRVAEEGVPDGELVAVEQDFLRGLHAGAPAAVDLVVQALDGPDVGPPVLVQGGRGVVGLLDPADNLAVHAFLEREGGRHDGVGVSVLGLQVRDHLGVVLLAQPVIRIDPPVAVGFEELGPFRGERRFGRDLGGFHYPVESR